MYSCYVLDEVSKKKLYFMFPPKYSDFIGHHITEKFGINSLDDMPDTPKLIQIIGYIDNGDGVEGFLVEVDGTSDRPSGGKYHLTWSIDRGKGYKPVNTNDYVHTATSLDPITINAEPTVIQ